jgi:tetratricopeptide (TPR) repeat protein
LQDYKEAVDIGERLQPHDGRLTTTLGELGRIAMGLQQFTEADAIFQYQLKVTEEVYGQQSPIMTEPPQNLSMKPLVQHDYVSGLGYLARALELNEKTYGENSSGVANSLRMVSHVYLAQNDYAKAEPIALRAVKIHETLFGHHGVGALTNLTLL